MYLVLSTLHKNRDREQIDAPKWVEKILFFRLWDSLDYYAVIGFCGTGLSLLLVCIQYMTDIRKYGLLEYGKRRSDKEPREIYHRSLIETYV